MQTIRTALVAGFRAALRLRWLLPLYLCGAVIGLLQTWPLLTAGGAALRNPFLADLASGGMDALVDLFLNNEAMTGPALGWSSLTLLLTLVNGLAYTFFAGGIVSEYAGRRSFWAGCRRFCWSFLALGGLLMLLAGVIVVIVAIVAAAGGGLIALVVALLMLALLNVVGEYARAVAVVRERRNPFAVLGMAFVFCARHLPGVLTFALIGAALHVLLTALYGVVARGLNGSVLLIVWQQLCVFGWLWIKGLRLAWATRYVIASEPDVDRGAIQESLDISPVTVDGLAHKQV